MAIALADDPHFDPGSHYNFFDASAYCVVDNNFAEPIFPNHTPLENLQVTAAHEFFHAVQFSYDAFEDQWFLEATATWMEDELYDAVNDNLQYLSSRPAGKAAVPLDKGATNVDPCCHVYGDWIFFRYLTEKYSPGLVKTIWKNADASEDTDGPGGRTGSGATTSPSRRWRGHSRTRADSARASPSSAGETASRVSPTGREPPTPIRSRR